MSILIKGMKAPTSCGQCVMSRWSRYEQQYMCNVGDKPAMKLASDYVSRKPSWCPIVEIPEPHGRLIDEENVIDAIHGRLEVLRTHEVFRRKHGDIDLLGVMPYIAKIPTVIEAEGSEDE